MSEFIRFTEKDGIAWVTLARAELHNAFDDAMMLQMTETFTKRAGDDAIRAVVISAEGKSFCAGADIKWMKRMVDYSFDENVADAMILTRMLRAIRECPRPVIARIHGATLGGGVGLVAACDMAVAVKSAFFSLSEVKLGIVPAVISPFVLEKIGAGHARRYAITGERFDAAEARRIGLVADVVDNEQDLDLWINEVLEAVRATGPQAVAACKKILNDVEDVNWDQLQQYTAGRIAEIRVSPEGQEGLKAFLEKRKPGWMP